MKSKANNIFEFKELRISVITQTWVRLEIVFFLDLSSKKLYAKFENGLLLCH